MSRSDALDNATYAIVEDVAASWEQYERFAAALADVVPDGLIVHAAGRTDEGFRIIELWTSEEAWRRFTRQLGTATGAHLAPGPRVFRDFRPTHLVVGHSTRSPRYAAHDGELDAASRASGHEPSQR